MIASNSRTLLLSCIAAWWFLSTAACATAPDQTEWIRIGKTTRQEVVERYGPPDFVIASGEEELATYRKRDLHRAPPRPVVPTVQAGPLGTVTTKMEPINPGLDAESTNAGPRSGLKKEIRIRYDARGIVQDVLQ